MNVTKLDPNPLHDSPLYTVILTQDEAIRLAYGPLVDYGQQVGHTARSLSVALYEAIAAPACFAPTREVLEDMPPQVLCSLTGEIHAELEGEFRP